MACPLFLPTSPLKSAAPEAMPLGDMYGGCCAADTAAEIPAGILRTCCNVGYARAVCERAARENADAFRFLVKAQRGAEIDVAWSSERNHHPVAVGLMHITGERPATPTPLERQAHACAMAYLRQTGAAA